jgi:hypothetical protein
MRKPPNTGRKEIRAPCPVHHRLVPALPATCDPARGALAASCNDAWWGSSRCKRLASTRCTRPGDWIIRCCSCLTFACTWALVRHICTLLRHTPFVSVSYGLLSILLSTTVVPFFFFFSFLSFPRDSTQTHVQIIHITRALGRRTHTGLKKMVVLSGEQDN